MLKYKGIIIYFHGGSILKLLFKKYSYLMVKLFITQCIISLLGFILALSSLQIGIQAITIALSVFSIGFYMFLVYITTWECGSKDMPAIEAGRTKRSVFTGLTIGLGASIHNFVLELVYVATLPFATADSLHPVEALSTVCGVSLSVMNFINGMYSSLMSIIKIGGTALNQFWWTYFLLPIPAIIITTAAYMLGSKEVHFTKLLLPVTPEEAEVRREAKRNKK